MDPLPPALAWSVLSPEAAEAPDLPRWMNAARAHFRAELSLVAVGDAATPWALGVSPAREVGRVTTVRLRTMPVAEAPEVVAAALRGCAAIGGAGMDALVARARRVWQVDARVDDGGDGAAPLVLAAVLANVLLGPVVPPEEVTVFGVRGARERLERAGWR